MPMSDAYPTIQSIPEVNGGRVGGPPGQESQPAEKKFNPVVHAFQTIGTWIMGMRDKGDPKAEPLAQSYKGLLQAAMTQQPAGVEERPPTNGPESMPPSAPQPAPTASPEPAPAPAPAAPEPAPARSLMAGQRPEGQPTNSRPVFAKAGQKPMTKLPVVMS